MLKALRAIAPVLISWPIAACGGSSADHAPPLAFVDPAVPVWRLAGDPALEIGGPDEREAYILDGVEGALVLGDGLVVADRGSADVRFYSLTGDLVWRRGGEGGAPGEYRALAAMVPVGADGVGVWDPELRRLTTLDRTGKVRGTVAADLSAAQAMLPAFVGVLDGGRLVFRDSRPEMTMNDVPTGERRDSIAYLILAGDGSGVKARYTAPGSEVLFTNRNGGWGSTEILFGRSALETVAGGALVFGANDSLTLKRLDYTGTIVQATMLPWRPVAVTSAQVEAARERRLDDARAKWQGSMGGLGGASFAQRFWQLDSANIADVPGRNTLPAFSDLLGERSGNTWIAQAVAPGAADRWWLAVDSLFRPIGRMRVPAEMTILDIEAEWLAALAKDELDRESVRLYRIEK